ncbi:MAG TPA: hypothetical protein VFD74_04805 [Thermoleophilia bacterium]|nr:hypothetical protein [Thermoleophilia bacterium]
MESVSEGVENLSGDEVRSRIAELEEELEDLAMERSMTLGGTGVHISAGEAERLRNEFERDEARVSARLAELRSLS